MGSRLFEGSKGGGGSRRWCRSVLEGRHYLIVSGGFIQWKLFTKYTTLTKNWYFDNLFLITEHMLKLWQTTNPVNTLC